MFGKGKKDGKPKASGGLSRREMLIGGGALLAGATGALAGAELLKSKEKRNVNVYEGADTPVTIETPAGPVVIDGWNIKFYKNKIRAKGPFSFTFTTDSGNKSEWHGWGGMYIGEENNGEENECVVMHSAPLENLNEPLYLHYEEKDENDVVVTREAYPIKLKAYTNKLETDYDTPFVYSEVPLDESAFKEIQEQYEAFEGFMLMDPTYLFNIKDPSNRGGIASSATNRVFAPAHWFTKPVFEKEGALKLGHELLHGVARRMQDMEEMTDQYYQLRKSYGAIVAAAGFTLPMPSFGIGGVPDEVENEPLFKIFDESFYVAKHASSDNFSHPSGYGHPYSDHDEMFASATTVLRFFPNDFIEEYAKLPESKRTLVRAEVVAILDLFNFSPKADSGDIVRLIPEYEKIVKAIGYKKPKWQTK